MLQNFRSTGGVPSTSSPGAAPSPSALGAIPFFTDLFKKDSVAQGPNAGQGVLGLDATRGSLKGPRSSKPFMTHLPSSIFRPELERNSKAVGAGPEENGSAIALKRHYSYEELGKRLGELRPAGAGKDGKEWFSLTELQGRIAKLAELEKQENRFARPQFFELRSGIQNLQKQEKPARQVNMNTLLNLGGQLDYMGRPPQEDLLRLVFFFFFFLLLIKVIPWLIYSLRIGCDLLPLIKVVIFSTSIQIICHPKIR
jgi:small subunit ribosomal protein S15